MKMNIRKLNIVLAAVLVLAALQAPQAPADIGDGCQPPRLCGSIDTPGSATYYFELGLTPAYGGIVPEHFAHVLVPESITMLVSATITEPLEPASLYHYRLVVIREGSTTKGPDRTFLTPPAPPPPELPAPESLPEPVLAAPFLPAPSSVPQPVAAGLITAPIVAAPTRCQRSKQRKRKPCKKAKRGVRSIPVGR